MNRKIIFYIFALSALLLSGCAQRYSQGPENHNNEANIISEDAAKKIALDQIPGATTQDIQRFESDYDNGILQYEGKIYYEQKEYEFEIDAYDGTILEWDVDQIRSVPL